MSRKNDVEQFVRKKIYGLESQAEESYAKTNYANLRRSLGKKPGEEPAVFGIILKDMPAEFLSNSGIPTREEWACYIALTLYAMHQQGYDPKKQSMNSNDRMISMGISMRNFVNTEEDRNAEERMQQRLQMLATAKDITELAYHLKGVIQLIKKRGIQCNYAKLASDLYEIQFQEQRAKICLRWGQDFFKKTNNTNVDNKEIIK